MKIETCDWSHPCGNGGCYSYGTTLYLDGKEVKGRTFFGQDTVETLSSEHED